VSQVASLRVHALACVRGQRVVFENLSFSLEAGQLLILEGANGSGKTSLLRLIAGLLEPHSGEICVDGVANSEQRAHCVGWLGHDDGIKPQLSSFEVLGFFARLYGTDPGAAGPALREVGLTRLADLPCHHLSAGQKRRLALARLKVCARSLWLMDEPLSALDDEGRALAADMIGHHIAQGGIAIAATHETLDIRALHLRLGA